MTYHDSTDDLPDDEYFARYGFKRPPLPPHLADLRSGQIRRYGHGPFHREIEPRSHGELALWHVVAPPLAAMLICAWVREWAQAPVGAQMEFDL